MGLAIDPSQTFDYVLVTDRQPARADAPAFTFRYLTARQANEAERLFDQSRSAEDATGVYGNAIAGIRLALVGWRNLPLEFDPASIDAVLSRADILELRDNLLHQMTLTQLEKKRLAFASPSTTAASAGPAVSNQTAPPAAA